ncbi:glucosaminidase domain-containing protein [Paenisporosarcina indica]|uniref:glucosaminidase domain-containing protein n=1 Tax=Paenisporosarcina indica TaxID=650093 RepID=UPI000A4226BB|nr:glucosaminidase domain-containing protein [Paenisporosarcina indica]
MKKHLRIILIMLLLCLVGLPTASANDGLTGLTLEKEMRAMIEKGILQGYGENDYRPKGEVTRDQFAAFIARTLQLPDATSTFIDVVPGSALAPKIGAIQATGIMKGTLNSEFMPSKPITREEMALTMSRVIAYKNLTVNRQNLTIADSDKFTLEGGIEAAILNASANIMKGQSSSSTIVFNPKGISLRDQVAAVLYRYLELVESQSSPEPEPNPNPNPVPIDPTKYYNAIIKDGKLEKGLSEYTSYASALTAFTNNSAAKGLYKGNELIKIKSGLAYAKHKTVDSPTVIYSDSSFTSSKQVTYVQYGRELVLLESTDQYVKVQAGGTIGFAKQSEIEYIPEELITSKDYYTPSSTGVLTHFTFNHAKNSFGFGGYQVGPAPSFMTNLQKYYSQDGVNFYKENGSLAGKHYPYFQYLSARAKTNYTASELDTYIMDRLQTVSTKYPTALTKSKLIGLGTFLKEVENTYNVNALFILSAAMHESDSGMSGNAQTKNNLFGIKVFDSSPEDGERYAKPQDSIIAFVTRYVNLNYGPPTGLYAKGLAPGNKTSGMNVHYASDPNWGSKIAQYMWRGDVLLGNKDTGLNTKKIAMTSHNGTINVRSTPEVVSGNTVFTYKAKDLGVNNSFGYPLVIVEEKLGSDGFVWYKVLSDQAPPADFGWIRSDLVNKLN